MVVNIRSRRQRVSWKYALVGAVIAMPLTFVVHVKTGSGIEFSSGTMVLGGGVAGYLAEYNSAYPRTTGALAGVVGVLPLLYWWSTVFQYIPFGYIPIWPNAVSQVARLLLMGAIIFLGSVLAGWIGGLLGGWVARKIHPVREPGVES